MRVKIEPGKRIIIFMAILGLSFILSWLPGAAATRRPVKVRVGLLDLQGAGSAGSSVEKGAVEFMALRRVFDIQGIPYDILTDNTKLRRYRVVYAGGSMLNRALSVDTANALFDYVELGGTLVAAGEVGNRMYSLFGVREHVPSMRRYRLTFSGKDESLRYIDHPHERTISLGNGEGHFYDDVIWSHGYRLEEDAVSLAFFEDGISGFIKNHYGRGSTYLIGLSFAESVLLPQVGNDYEAQRQFVNSFEPSADVIMLILKGVYEGSYSPFIYLSTAPFARPTAVILSHDVDAQTSFVDSLKFADLEERYGVKSTFFMNTKYFVDWMDIDYYNIEENKEAIRVLQRRGWEIGSHTVSHYKQFSEVVEGSPDITFKSYNPLEQVTVQGEVRVSKELLDRDVPGQRTVSFRAGDLEFPHPLIRVLAEAGYLYDSTYSANDVLTAFPYMATSMRHLGSPESRVIEMPVTLDDSLGFLTSGSVDLAVENWLEVAAAHRDNEAITVLLIHPSDTRKETFKLEAQEKFMQEVLEMDAWVGDIQSYGKFWQDRHDTDFQMHRDSDGSLIIEVAGNASEIDNAVGFVVGNVKGTPQIKVVDGNGNLMAFETTMRGEKIFLGGRFSNAR